MDRAIFFSHIRNDPFSGTMTQSQGQGVNALIDAWPATVTLQQMAYVLATVFHETGARMVPVREGFKRTDKEARAYVKRQGYKYAEPDPVTGEVYYGRGLPQATWARNYKLLGDRIGVDLYHNPDLMLNPAIGEAILFEGMIHGLFTGKCLDDYFKPDGWTDPLNARRIINGMDRAGMIAGYYTAFLTALQAANGQTVVIPEPERTTPAPRYAEDLKPLASSRTIIGSGIAGASTIGGAVVDQVKEHDVKDAVDYVPVTQTATEAVQDAKDAVSGTLGIWSYAGWALLVLALLGVGLVIYSKWDRRRKGQS